MKVYTFLKLMKIELIVFTCDKLCIERFYKNHLKSQTHFNITRKRQQSSTHFRCDFFDIDMQIVSRNICLKSFN